MATLTAIKFDTPEGTGRLEAALQDLQRQQLITVLDAAVVSWPAEAKKPTTSQPYSASGVGALGGAFWGFLFGLIFFLPLPGRAAGAATGAVLGYLADIGIEDDFIEQARDRITPAPRRSSCSRPPR